MNEGTTWKANPSPSRTRRVLKALGKLLVAAALVAGLGWAATLWMGTAETTAEEITATAVCTNLSITVTERGELESSKTVDVRCEVEGYKNKIVEIVPEGTTVEKDQVVVRFDAEELTRQHAEQEIRAKQAEQKAKTSKEDLEVQKNKAESEIAQKELALQLAELDRNKYLEGDYKIEEENIKGSIALAERDLEEAKEKLEHYRKFVKKGFGTPAQLRVREQEVRRTEFFLERDKSKLHVLQEFTRRRQEVELTAKAEEAKRELERAKRSQAAQIAKAETDFEAAEVTAKLERQRLERLQKQLDHCTVKAPQDGILVYSKERYWDESSRIRVGAMVSFQQAIFSLPDLTQMQVKVKVHESNVKKVKAGQKTEIRIDALRDVMLQGTIDKVATMAESGGFWQQGVKEYETIVKVDEVPTDAGLKPGMSAEVKIFVDELTDVLIIPVQSVAEEGDQHYSYVLDSEGFTRKPVTVGQNSESFVEIRDGLTQGERVALDARARLTAETNSRQAEQDGLGQKPEAVPPVASSPGGEASAKR